MRTSYDADRNIVFPHTCPAEDCYGKVCGATLVPSASGRSVYCPADISHYSAGQLTQPTLRDVFATKGFDWTSGSWDLFAWRGEEKKARK